MNVAVKLHKENHQKAEARHGKGGGKKTWHHIFICYQSNIL